ncbi:TSPAN8 [Bugula neritina]|uniref:TSPAN8 n=1 Tax=Bugula neritina TaxID=10212 RepID=A0A7J7JEZ4_BUGNE|nr:TSPAN8 [Bugula neritina]
MGSGSGLSGCFACIKYLMFAFNFIFWLIGCALVGFGIWVLVDDTFKELAADTSFAALQYAGIGIIVVGCVIMIIGFFGCCGAIRESKCLLVSTLSKKLNFSCNKSYSDLHSILASLYSPHYRLLSLLVLDIKLLSLLLLDIKLLSPSPRHQVTLSPSPRHQVLPDKPVDLGRINNLPVRQSTCQLVS